MTQTTSSPRRRVALDSAGPKRTRAYDCSPRPHSTIIDFGDFGDARDDFNDFGDARDDFDDSGDASDDFDDSGDASDDFNDSGDASDDFNNSGDAVNDLSDLSECDDVRHDVCNDFNGFDDEGDDRQGTAKARERGEGGRSTADSEVRVTDVTEAVRDGYDGSAGSGGDPT